MKNKKGVSPVVATVLLIAMVVVLALIIFLWFRGMSEETITKFGEENIKLACDKVGFDASYSLETIYISNRESVPLFGMKVKAVGDGKHETVNLEGFEPLGIGGAGSYTFDADEYTEIVLIPVLLGTDESGAQKSYVCDEKHGVTLEV